MKRGLLYFALLSMVVLLTGCREGTQPQMGPTLDAPAQPAGRGAASRGGEVYLQYCASCHGPEAEGSALGPSLVSAQVAARDQTFLEEILAKGKPGTSMPAWDGLLNPLQIEDVIAFLRSKQ